MATNTYTPIASITLGSSASSVTFSSIPQDYRDLVLVVNGGQSSFAAVEISPNGDSSNASLVKMQGNGSSFFSSTKNEISFDFFTSNALVVAQVMDYSATDKHKTFLIRINAAQAITDATAARWASTAAITSLVIGDTGSSTINSGTTLALYGIAS